MLMEGLVEAIEYGDRLRVRNLRILCSECAQSVDDATLNRLWKEEKISFSCRACGHKITVTLADLDAIADAHVEKRITQAREVKHT